MFFHKRNKQRRQVIEAKEQKALDNLDNANKVTRHVNNQLANNGITLRIYKATRNSHAR